MEIYKIPWNNKNLIKIIPQQAACSELLCFFNTPNRDNLRNTKSTKRAKLMQNYIDPSLFLENEISFRETDFLNSPELSDEN